MNLAIFFPIVKVIGIASTHFVKYSVAMRIKLCPLEEVGFIFPTRSNPHYENGHGDVIGQRS